jgi:hypothetical protein
MPTCLKLNKLDNNTLERKTKTEEKPKRKFPCSLSSSFVPLSASKNWSGLQPLPPFHPHHTKTKRIGENNKK